MSQYQADHSVLIASADCSTQSRQPGTGAALCNAENVRGYPTIKYGPSNNLRDYNGARDFATLKAFVESHAGPSPSPPSPPAPPSPSTSHYEHPPCQSDEVEVQVQGISGVMCAPSCTSSACPTDVPAGVSARPGCLLRDSSSGSRYCALQCSSDGDCDAVGGASCQPVSNIGLCTYPEAANRMPPTCPIMTESTNTSKAVVV
jgi:hypothetical protein